MGQMYDNPSFSLENRVQGVGDVYGVVKKVYESLTSNGA